MDQLLFGKVHPFIGAQFGTTTVLIVRVAVLVAVVYVYVVTSAGGSVVVACTMVVTVLSIEIL